MVVEGSGERGRGGRGGAGSGDLGKEVGSGGHRVGTDLGSAVRDKLAATADK